MPYWSWITGPFQTPLIFRYHLPLRNQCFKVLISVRPTLYNKVMISSHLPTTAWNRDILPPRHWGYFVIDPLGIFCYRNMCTFEVQLPPPHPAIGSVYVVRKKSPKMHPGIWPLHGDIGNSSQGYANTSTGRPARVILCRDTSEAGQI